MFDDIIGKQAEYKFRSVIKTVGTNLKNIMYSEEVLKDICNQLRDGGFFVYMGKEIVGFVCNQKYKDERLIIEVKIVNVPLRKSIVEIHRTLSFAPVGHAILKDKVVKSYELDHIDIVPIHKHADRGATILEKI